MACMEFICHLCEFMWFGNDLKPKCSRCGSDRVTQFYDDYNEEQANDCD